MSSIRDRIEAGFEAFGAAVCRRAWLVIALLALVVGGLAAQGSRVVMDTSPEGMLHGTDPARLAYDALRREFEGDSPIVVGVRAPATFDDAFLARLGALHGDLERDVPHLENVTSLVNARYTRGEDEAFVVGDLVPDWRAGGGDARSLRRFALAHPLYRDNFLSADGSLAAVVLETRSEVVDGAPGDADPLAVFAADGADLGRRPFSPVERAEVVDAVRAVLARHAAPDFQTVLSGSPVIVDAFDRTTLRDTTQCVIASIVGIYLLLWFFFRRLSGVLLPNVVVAGAVAATVGLMGLAGAPFTLSSPGIFAILIAVGTCSAVHLLTIFYRRLAHGDERRTAVAFAVGHAGPAIVMTALTTAAGLASFVNAPLASTAEMGLYSAAGVLLTLVLTLTLIPAILAVSPIRPHVASPAGSRGADRGLIELARFATRNHRPILAGSLVVLALGVLGARSLHFAHDPVSYFDADVPVRVDLETIDRELRGGTTLEVVIDSGRANGLYDPALLHGIDRASSELPQVTGDLMSAIRVFSINDVVKETNQALHANEPAHYALPSDGTLLSQQLFLFEQSGSDDLERMVDPQYRTTRVSIKTPYADGLVYREFVERVRGLFRQHLDGLADVTVTGAMALEAQAIPYALETMAQGYVVAFVVISVMMIAFLGGLRIGLVAMVPNLLPILAVMGLMGLAGVPLDQTTIVIGSIGLGLVVDDTIHFLYNFQKYHRRTGDVTRAVEEAFLSAGRAMVVTSVVLVACFWVDLLATLSNINRFGFLVGLIVLAALVADFLVAPALMRLLNPENRPLESSARSAVAAGLAVVVFLVPSPARAGDAEDDADARRIMERVDAREDGDHVVMDIHMTLIDRNGRERERRATAYRRDRDDGGIDSVLFFLEPADVRGTGFLTHDHPDPVRSDDQWLFLPALGRSKRISSSEKSRPFMGSDFSYADMTVRSPDRYRYSLMKDEVAVDGHPTWQIEAVPVDDAEREETGYRRSVVFVRQDVDVVVRAIHWLDGSDEIKLLEVKQLERIDGIWTPLEIHMSTGRDRRVEHKTILRNTRVDYRQQLPDNWFTIRRLEKGS
jgi:uncharacterized protein